MYIICNNIDKYRSSWAFRKYDIFIYVQCIHVMRRPSNNISNCVFQLFRRLNLTTCAHNKSTKPLGLVHNMYIRIIRTFKYLRYIYRRYYCTDESFYILPTCPYCMIYLYMVYVSTQVYGTRYEHTTCEVACFFFFNGGGGGVRHKRTCYIAVGYLYQDIKIERMKERETAQKETSQNNLKAQLGFLFSAQQSFCTYIYIYIDVHTHGDTIQLVKYTFSYMIYTCIFDYGEHA